MTIVGPHSRQFFLRYYLNYKKSGKPKRVMFYNNGEWLDYPRDIVSLVKNDLEMKKAALEIRLNGCELILDFLHMCQVDLKTDLQQPIAWIVEVGGCFFPETCVVSDGKSYNLWEHERVKLCIEIKVNEVDESKLRECSGEPKNKVGFVPYAESIQGNLDLDDVQKIFLNGMNIFDSIYVEIVEAYRCLGTLMQAQLELFQTQAKITKELHGDANFRYAWLPFSKEDLSTMMKYGLGHCPLCATKCTYGAGVYLAAVTCPYASARYCDTDEKGVRHLVLCRLIMGSMEVFFPGIGSATGQFQPRKSKYDTGVDDIQCPRYYTVWNTNINTYIYPEFIISFKVSGNAEDYFCGKVRVNNDSGANSSSSNLTSHGSSDFIESATSVDNEFYPFFSSSDFNAIRVISMLVLAITDKVSSSDMSFIKAHYELYKILSNDELEGSNQNEGRDSLSMRN
ncbi:probable inactive poly [ADP-ribose] polymerase SRO1 [Lotus japonicus]|uniref:probable inactive poly [ADP-ribose] polymerase SRO1 n=1 Tax=Lotus japonicus TaxID=34305 RepID=UPI002589C0A2|nr:probable inactive poly [ADP-ribose] polymerase SRO1 [Lotus japonicus]